MADIEDTLPLRFVTILDAAEFTGLSASFIRSLASRGLVPSKRVGKRMYLVDVEVLVKEEYLKDPNSRRRCYRRGNKPEVVEQKEQ
jgi:hypothetical protein